MVDDELKKDLISHKIYSAWQFIEYTEKNIATVRYCAETIDSLIKKMTMKTVRWEQDVASDFVMGRIDPVECVGVSRVRNGNVLNVKPPAMRVRDDCYTKITFPL